MQTTAELIAYIGRMEEQTRAMQTMILARLDDLAVPRRSAGDGSRKGAKSHPQKRVPDCAQLCQTP
jgi:hypothetical protein